MRGPAEAPGPRARAAVYSGRTMCRRMIDAARNRVLLCPGGSFLLFKVIQVSAQSSLSTYTNVRRAAALRAAALRAARLEGFAPSSVVTVHAQRGLHYSLKFLINGI